MAIKTFTGPYKPAYGITISIQTDSFADEPSVPNSTSFYDLATKLVYYKNSSAQIINPLTKSQKGTTTASAADLTLPTDGDMFQISGTTTINAIMTAGWTSGFSIILEFTGSTTLKHNTAGGAGTAVCKLAGSADFTTAADSVIGLYYNGTVWQETFRKTA